MTDGDRLAVLAEPIPVPTHVDLSEDGEWVLWDRFAAGPPDPRRPGVAALAEFLGLRDPVGGPEAVRGYAQRWGILAVCPHWFPTSHAPADETGPGSPVFPEHTECLPFGAYDEPHYTDARRRGATEALDERAAQAWRWSHASVLTGAEPIWYWQATAAAFGAVLSLATQLRAGELGRHEDWLAVYEWPPGHAVPIRFGQWEAPTPPPADPMPWPGSWSTVLWAERAEAQRALAEARGTWNPPHEAPNSDAEWTAWLQTGGVRSSRDISAEWPGVPIGGLPQTTAGQRATLAAFVDRWLALGAVRPVFRWAADQEPRLSFKAGGLFGALAVHLAVRVANGQGWAICNGCGAPYAPRRLVRSGRRAYCDQCRRDRVPDRDAHRDWRVREADKAKEAAKAKAAGRAP
ncbi:MAG: hypothetical protein WAO09_07350 [Candidatus Dormiibacterota bacterium]